MATPPRLSLPDILSRSFVTPLVLIVLLIQSKISSFQSLIQSECEHARELVRSTCYSIETTAAVFVNVPEVTARTTNALLEEAAVYGLRKVEATIDGTVDLLTALMKLVVGHYLGTLACILDFLTSATLGSLQYYADTVQSFVNLQVAQVADAVVSGVNAINDALIAAQQTGLGALQGFLNSLPGVPQVDLTSPGISMLPQVNLKLQGLEAIPQDFVNSFKAINVPSAVDAEAQLLQLVEQPAKMLKSVVSDKLSSITLFRDLLPLPAHTDRVIICSAGNDTSRAIDGFERTAVDSLQHITLILWALIAVVVVGSALEQIARYVSDKRVKDSVRGILERCNEGMGPAESSRRGHSGLKGGPSEPSHDSGPLVDTIFERIKYPFSYFLGNSVLLLPYARSPIAQDRLQWFVRYVSHPESLAIILAGILGLAVVGFMRGVMMDLSDNLRAGISSEMTQWEDSGRDAISVAIRTVTTPYISGVNSALEDVEFTINDDVFGWIAQLVDPVKVTLEAISEEFTGLISTAFASVPPIQQALLDLVGCMILRKVEELDTALDALAGAMSVKLPRLNDASIIADVQSPLRIIGVARESVVGIYNTSTKEWQGRAVGDVVARLEESLDNDALFFSRVLMFGLIVPAVGLARIGLWVLSDAWRRKVVPRLPSVPWLEALRGMFPARLDLRRDMPSFMRPRIRKSESAEETTKILSSSPGTATSLHSRPSSSTPQQSDKPRSEPLLGRLTALPIQQADTTTIQRPVLRSALSPPSPTDFGQSPPSSHQSVHLPSSPVKRPETVVTAGGQALPSARNPPPIPPQSSKPHNAPRQTERLPKPSYHQPEKPVVAQQHTFRKAPPPPVPPRLDVHPQPGVANGTLDLTATSVQPPPGALRLSGPSAQQLQGKVRGRTERKF